MITLGISTAQTDYPLPAYPKTHIFEYTMSALRKQTVKDFDVVVADVYYDTRSDYFQKHPEDFPVQHVPVKPNVWIKRGCPAICATKNTYLMYAKGEYTMNLGDCWHPFPEFIEKTYEYLKNYKYVNYLYEVYLGDEFKIRDHRTNEKIIHGNVVMKTEDWVELNGYDELLDGNKGLEDCDLAFRINTKDGNKNGIFLATPYLKRQVHNTFPLFYGCNEKSKKCLGLIFEICRQRDSFGLYQANKIPLSKVELHYLKKCAFKQSPYICYRHLPKQITCHSTQSNMVYLGTDDKLNELNNHPSLYFNLREQRKDPIKAIEILKKQVENG